MHEPIRQNLENLIRGGKLSASVRETVESHLADCSACVEELRVMRLHSGLMKVLRPDNAAEPTGGFYARVMQRIEAEGTPSFWNLLLDPVFGLRLVYATASLVLLMGAFLLATTESLPELASTPVEIMAKPQPAAPVTAVAFGEDMSREREHFLVTMASFTE